MLFFPSFSFISFSFIILTFNSSFSECLVFFSLLFLLSFLTPYVAPSLIFSSPLISFFYILFPLFLASPAVTSSSSPYFHVQDIPVFSSNSSLLHLPLSLPLLVFRISVVFESFSGILVRCIIIIFFFFLCVSRSCVSVFPASCPLFLHHLMLPPFLVISRQGKSPSHLFFFVVIFSVSLVLTMLCS